MDARRRDASGRTICPGCGKAYWPALGERDPNLLIQVQFPKATPAQREELMTGYCQKCQSGIFGSGPAYDDSPNCRVIKHFVRR